MRAEYREESKKNYGRQTDSGNLGNDDLKVGCLMRIADATEAMAKNHQALIDERDRYKRYYEAERAQSLVYYRSMCALKGVITKLKKHAV